MHVISDHQQKIQINHSHQQINTKTTSPMENLATREGISVTHSPSLARPAPLSLPLEVSQHILHTLRKDMYKSKVQGVAHTHYYSNSPPSPDNPVPAATSMTSTMAPRSMSLTTISRAPSSTWNRDHMWFPKVAVPDNLCLHRQRLHYISFTYYLPSLQNEPEFAPFSDHLVAALHSKASSRSLSPAVWRLKSPRLSKVLLEKYDKFH